MVDYLLKYKIVADAYAAKAEVKSLDDLFGQVGKKAATSLGSLAAPAGVAIGAITGVAGALFGLSKQAAEYGSAIHDASDKTGLHAETLSAMGLAAKQSNTELDQITGGIAKYAKTVGEAADGSEKAAQKLKAFGVTPKEAIDDLDGSLAKVFKRIVDAKPGIEQITLAQKAFGKSGADLLPFIKQFDGDLPKLIAKAKELGLTLSDQDAAAADAFGDQMDQLEMQIGAASRAIGKEFMPAFTKMATDVSDWLAANKGETKSWADSFAQYLEDLSFKIKVLALDAREAAAEIAALFNTGFLADTSKPTALDLPSIYERFQKERAELIYQAENQVPKAIVNAPKKKVGADTDTFGAGSKKKAEKIGDAAPSKRAVEVLKAVISPSKFDAAMKEAAAQVAKETGVDEDIVFTLLKATVFRESSGIAGQRSSAGATGLTQQLAGTSKRLGPGSEFVKAARYLVRGFGGEGYQAGGASEAFATYFAGGSGTGRGAKTKAYVRDQSWVFQHAKQVLEGLDKISKKDKEVSDESIKNDEEATARKYEIGQTFAESMVELQKQEYESSLKYNDFKGALKAAQEAHDQTVQNVQDEIAALEEKAAKTKVGSDEERRAVDAVTLARIKGDRAIQQADKDLADQIEEVQNKQADLFIDLIQNADHAKDAIDRLGTGMAELISAQDAAGATKEFEGTFKQGHKSFIDRLFGGTDQAQSDAELHKQIIGDLRDFTMEAFGQMANAVGSSVEAWVLYGDSIGGSLKKATAQVLANLAAQATVKAIFELAEGFASLAVGDFYGASQHFTSAAIFGTLAAVTAIGGRALAGDSFKNKGGKGSSAAGASGGSYGGTSSGSSNQNLTPYSRSGPDAYISGSRNSDPHVVMLAHAVQQLSDKVSSMPAGDVLTAGIKQRPNMIAKTMVKETARSPQIGKGFMKTTRIK